MKIQNNSFSTYKQPNFTSIKSLQCSGLYKKYPELGKELVDTLKENPRAMDFFKKYDVDIVFHAVKQGMERTMSSIYIFYDNIAKSKFRNALAAWTNSRDKVHLTMFGAKYQVDKSLKDSTAALKDAIQPGNIGCGMLDMHLDFAEETMQKALAKKAEKAAAKLKKQQAKEAAQTKIQTGKQDLENSINDLISKSGM